MMKIQKYKDVLVVAFSQKSYLYKGFLFALEIPFVSLVTNPMAWGYVFRVGAGAMRGEKKLPIWKNSGKLWIDFVIASFSMMVYFATAFFIILGIKFVSGGFLLGSIGPEIVLKLAESTKDGSSLMVPMWDKVFALLVALPFLYAMPTAAINWFSSGKLTHFFDFSLVWGRAFRREYFLSSIVITLLNLVVPLFLWVVSFVFDYEKYLKMIADGGFSTDGIFSVFVVVVSIALIIVVGIFSYGISLFSAALLGRTLREIDKKDFKQGKNKAKVLYLGGIDTPEAGTKAPGEGR